MILNERIRLARKDAGLTQEQVAGMIGITGRNYQRLEADGGKPSYDNLLKIAELFEVSADWLMGRTEKREVNR